MTLEELSSFDNFVIFLCPSELRAVLEFLFLRLLEFRVAALIAAVGLVVLVDNVDFLVVDVDFLVVDVDFVVDVFVVFGVVEVFVEVFVLEVVVFVEEEVFVVGFEGVEVMFGASVDVLEVVLDVFIGLLFDVVEVVVLDRGVVANDVRVVSLMTVLVKISKPLLWQLLPL